MEQQKTNTDDQPFDPSTPAEPSPYSTTQTNIRLSDALRAKLTLIAESRGGKMADVIKTALDEYAQKNWEGVPK